MFDRIYMFKLQGRKDFVEKNETINFMEKQLVGSITKT